VTDATGATASARDGTSEPDSAETPMLRVDIEDCAELLREVAPDAQVDVVKGRFLPERARLELEDAVSLRYAYLDTDLPGELALRLYPGDTLEQARLLYADRDRCRRMLALRERGWEVEPNFHFGFMTRGLTWTRSRLTADEYVDYWIDRIEATTAIPRADWDAELRHLTEAGVFDPDDMSQFHDDFGDTARTSASPRPGLALTYRFAAADGLRPGFTQELRGAVWEALTTLGEPLSALSPGFTSTPWKNKEAGNRTVPPERINKAQDGRP
jgi:hypothetical protein